MKNNANKSFQITGISCSSSRAEIHETKVNASGIMTMEKKDTFVLNPLEKIIITKMIIINPPKLNIILLFKYKKKFKLTRQS